MGFFRTFVIFSILPLCYVFLQNRLILFKNNANDTTYISQKGLAETKGQTVGPNRPCLIKGSNWFEDSLKGQSAEEV